MSLNALTRMEAEKIAFELNKERSKQHRNQGVNYAPEFANPNWLVVTYVRGVRQGRASYYHIYNKLFAKKPASAEGDIIDGKIDAAEIRANTIIGSRITLSSLDSLFE